MKKIVSVTIIFLVVLMAAPVFAESLFLGQSVNPMAVTSTPPINSIFVNPAAKGLGQGSKPVNLFLGQSVDPMAVTSTPPINSIFVNPAAKGLMEGSKPAGMFLGQSVNPMAVTPAPINIFTGAPY